MKEKLILKDTCINNATVEIEMTEDNIQAMEKAIAEYKETAKEPKTIEDIWKRINEKTLYGAYYIDSQAQIKSMGDEQPVGDPNAFMSDKRPRQIRALMMLMQVADELNEKEVLVPDNKGDDFYYIIFDVSKKLFKTASVEYTAAPLLFFKSKEIANKAIEILGEKTIKESLGIFED